MYIYIYVYIYIYIYIFIYIHTHTHIQLLYMPEYYITCVSFLFIYISDMIQYNSAKHHWVDSRLFDLSNHHQNDIHYDSKYTLSCKFHLMCC